MIELLTYLQKKGYIIEIKLNGNDMALFIYENYDDVEYNDPLVISMMKDFSYLENAISHAFFDLRNFADYEENFVKWSKTEVDLLKNNGYSFNMKTGFFFKETEFSKEVIVHCDNHYKIEEYSTDYDDNDRPFETFNKSFWENLKQAIE